MSTRLDTTGRLTLSAPTSPGYKKRRFDAICYSPSHSVRASTHSELGDGVRRASSARHSVAERIPHVRRVHELQRPRAKLAFGQDASLVLIGTKGSGLSSFAVIAAKALRFRLIDTEAWLVEHQGLRRSAYVKEKGLDAYRNISSAALKEILNQHGTRCIIVCGPEALEPRCQPLIRKFALSHPVIMINRDLTTIQRYLGLENSNEVLHILKQSQQLCRQISNLEFFNLPESEADFCISAEISQRLRRKHTPNSPSLLRNVKQDFLQFLSLFAGTPGSADLQLYPASPSDREYSTVLQLEDVAAHESNLSNLDFGTDAIELIVRNRSSRDVPYDWDRISRSLQMVRRRSKAPIIYHTECDDQKILADKDEYTDLLHHGLRLLPDFITVNLGCTDRQVHDFTSSVGQTQVIGHRLYAKGGLTWKDSALHKEFDRAVALGCHVVRFVREAKSASEDRDCVAFQAAITSRSKVPLIAYNTGIVARSAMVLNSCLTSVRQPNVQIPDPSTSLLTLPQLMKAKFSSFIYQPLHFHIFGASIDYSLSPMMHNAAFDALAMEHIYTIKQSPDLRDLTALMDDTFGGASVSLPFKSRVISLLDSMSEAATAIQAVNTVLPSRATPISNTSNQSLLSRSCRNRAGPISGLHGENTDWIAIYVCISRYLSPANAIKPSSSALVIGAGGMARASIYALLKMGVRNIVIWNRTLSKAHEVRKHFTTLCADPQPEWLTHQSSSTPSGTAQYRIMVVETLDAPWPDIDQPTMVVCTIPAHRIGDATPPEFQIPQQWFRSRTGGVIIELSYRSAWTPLLQQAHENVHKGWICVEPLEILIEQGCAQFELFTGYPAPQRRMQDSIMDGYAAIHVTEETD
ncbi:hypothetical protein E4T43_02609 [Aureobasidium subglaciale]|nr:hypothetical protein E4T43_02609 [Aureobasidium subglaciale]